ncbi:MAG: hypothetical protein ABSE70_10985 [Candidatus Limnocylindrales bacterium]
MRTPTWDEIREFLRYDRWTPDKPRSTDHDYFTKTLPDGEILITKVSRSGQKTMSAGRFKAILADQLHVAEADFWEVLRSKRPATRPVPAPEPEPVSLPLWLARELERLGVAPEEMEKLDEGRARTLRDTLRSRPSTDQPRG